MLRESGCVAHIKHGVKLLGGGAGVFTTPGVRIEVSAASAGAIAAVEGAGGGAAVTSVYLTRLALHAHLHPERYDIPIRAPRPPPRKMRYYTDFRTRGYLSADLQLARLRERLAAAGPAGAGAAATFLTPLWVGGAPLDAARVLTDIDAKPWEQAPAPGAARAKTAP